MTSNRFKQLSQQQTSNLMKLKNRLAENEKSRKDKLVSQSVSMPIDQSRSLAHKMQVLLTAQDERP